MKKPVTIKEGSFGQVTMSLQYKSIYPLNKLVLVFIKIMLDNGIKL